jgi:hypothetical protein
LTKYNPDYVPPDPTALAIMSVEGSVVEPRAELIRKFLAYDRQKAHHGLVSDYAQPYHYAEGNFHTTLTMEFQMQKVISDSGTSGITIQVSTRVVTSSVANTD